MTESTRAATQLRCRGCGERINATHQPSCVHQGEVWRQECVPHRRPAAAKPADPGTPTGQLELPDAD